MQCTQNLIVYMYVGVSRSYPFVFYGLLIIDITHAVNERRRRVIAICLCVCVCLLPHNLGECFVLLFFEPIAGRSPSNNQLWRFLKNILVAEKS